MQQKTLAKSNDIKRVLESCLPGELTLSLMNSRSGLLNVLKVDQALIHHCIRDSTTQAIITPEDIISILLSWVGVAHF